MGLSLDVQNLRVTSGHGRTLLEVSELTVEPGSSLGICGPSGAGKSTFLFALAGLQDTVEGQINWGEAEFSKLRPAEKTTFRSQNIGLIFQDFLLFDELSAQVNAALPALFAPRKNRANLRQRAADQLSRLGLKNSDRGAASFSGGERQRIAVARALSKTTQVLLADEPTASLDRTAADHLIEDLTGLSRASGQTLIVVSHDEALLNQMDRVVTFADGRLMPNKVNA
ncbi:MAG: ATP-binding cassette domain-containing protein [Pelagimonas sp.]|jgi:putative ABC transport system ATP-binding protein|nr:ATP-binding cassette domain-containing protein [Pelagimonas sp.]